MDLPVHTFLLGLTFTPSLTRLWTRLGLRGALLSHMLVSSLRMANTLPRPHPEFRRLGVEDSDRDKLGIFQLHQDLRLLELLLRLEVAVAIICVDVHKQVQMMQDLTYNKI